ncbi:MAG: proline dehydrogenase family protein [Anaerolineae bacterium]
MLRATLIQLSRSSTANRWVVRLPPARSVAHRFVPGETLAEAMAEVARLNRRGALVTLDHLGENVTSPDEADAAAQKYIAALEEIAVRDLGSTISVKLTQLGLATDPELCWDRVARIVETAGDLGNLVEIDMEESRHTEATLDIYYGLRSTFENVRVCLQAYLYRTVGDLERLWSQGGNIRLCKGAYREAPAIAFPRKQDVDRAFMRAMDQIFSRQAQSTGTYLAIATHDERLISWATAESETRGIPKEAFEFQMLYGIRTELQRALRDRGFTVRIYLPFGTQWYPYFMRRIAERPANLILVLRNLLRR